MNLPPAVFFESGQRKRLYKSGAKVEPKTPKVCQKYTETGLSYNPATAEGYDVYFNVYV